MSLQAPEHLRGKMTNAPDEIRAARIEWIIETFKAGHSGLSMDRALGVSPGTCAHALRRSGIDNRAPKLEARSLYQIGLEIGAGREPFNAMPYAARAAVVDSAAKTGKTIIETLADFWAAHHGEEQAA